MAARAVVGAALVTLLAVPSPAGAVYETDCGATLQMGQYLCLDLNIDPTTQQPAGCTPQGKALGEWECRPACGKARSG